MLNQLRADYYKLFHSKLFWVTGSLFAGFFVIFIIISLQNDTFSMGSVLGYKKGIPLYEGFIGFVFQDPANPLFWELAYSSTVLTSSLWLVLMILSVQFISKEYQTGTIKLAVSYGINMFKIHLSKWIVVISYFGLLFYLFNLVTFTTISILKNYIPTLGNVVSLLTLISLYYLVLAIFSLICFVLYIAIKNNDAVSWILSLFMFSPVVIAAVYGYDRPFPLDCYLRINPMYYLASASRFWADSAVTESILLYVAIGIPFLLVCSHFLLRKQEIK
jgi:ABC-2 type transport system permease protein